MLDGGVPASGGVGTLPPPSNDVEEIAEIDAAVAAIDAAIADLAKRIVERTIEAW